MFGLPLAVVVGISFVLGCIIGSFLDVFISRFHTGRSINGRSHCTSCGHVLDWYELFPVLSYLFLRGRCRVCGAGIPARLLLMELLTGSLFVLVVLSAASVADIAFGLILVALAVVITVYDIRHLIIPDGFVLTIAALASTELARLYFQLGSTAFIPSYVISGVVAALFFYCLWWVSRGQWIGLGDAKLTLPLAAMLSAPETFSFVVLSFWVGALISLFLLLLQRIVGRGQNRLRFFSIPLTMKSEVPFAPFLLVAFALVYFYEVDVLRLFSIMI